MTNYEHYKSEIEKFARMGIKVAVKKDTNEIVSCIDVGSGCDNCLFGNYGNCAQKSIAWADAEYIEQEVDWSKVPVDTPVFVSDDGTNWVKGYFAKYKDGKIYAFTDDAHRGIVRGQQAEIVRKWAEEHPRKTRKDVLLEKLPNALMFKEGYPQTCCALLGFCSECEKTDACEECWNTEVEE